MMSQLHARTAYASVAGSTRVEGADPHRLIMLLFEEGLDCITRVELGLMNGATDVAGQAAAKARSILTALKGSLDFEKGGRIAADLEAIYTYCQDRLAAAIRMRDAAFAKEAKSVFSEIADGWQAIASDPAVRR